MSGTELPARRGRGDRGRRRAQLAGVRGLPRPGRARGARAGGRARRLGGNTRTEELTLPGFAHDSCSSAHVLIQNNPLIRDDELGLVADHGLRLPRHRPRRRDAAGRRRRAGHAPRPRGDRATSSPAGRRPTPGRSQRLIDGVDAAGSRRPTAAGARTCRSRDDAVTAALPRAARAQRLGRRARAFEHPVVRSFMLWLAMATIQDPRRPGTGLPALVARRRPSRLRVDHPGRREPGPARRVGRRDRAERRPGRLLRTGRRRSAPTAPAYAVW